MGQQQTFFVSQLKALLAGALIVGLPALRAPAAPIFVSNHACVRTNSPSLFILPFNLTNYFIQITPSIRHGLFRTSDTVAIATAGQAPIRIVSLCGEELYAGAPGAFQFPVGHYFVETSGDRTQFAVLPNDYAGASFLGTGAKNGGSMAFDISNAERVDQTYSAWARYCGGNNWAGTEPQRGVWNWATSDAFVTANQGRKIIYNCGFIRPTWVGNSEFVKEFVEYVRAVAKRYNGRIYAIEIWNEPTFESGFLTNPTMDWRVVAQSYAQLLQKSCFAVRSVSSSIKIVGPAWYEGGFVSETATIAQLGGNLYLDALSSHDYMMPFMAPDFTGNYYVDNVHWVSSIDSQCADYRSVLPGKPILIDEIGLFGHSALGINWTNGVNAAYLTDLDWDLAMWRASKYVVMYRAGGADALTPHVFTMNAEYPEGNLELYGWDLGPHAGTSRGPHPKTTAFLMAGYWLNNATFLGRQTSTSNESVYAWSRPGGSAVVFAWCREGYSTTFSPDPTWQVTDIFGQPTSDTVLADRPILFHVPGPASSALGAVTTALQPPQPDYPNFIVPGLSGPPSAAAGENIRIIESVQNIGCDAGAFSVGVYLWSQETGNILIGTRALDGLAAGETSLATNSIILPANVRPGAYALASVADYLDQTKRIPGSVNSRWSSGPIVSSGATTNSIAQPNRPTNLTATAVSSTQINLTWQHDSINTAGFQIKRAPALTGPWTRVATLPAWARTYSDTGLVSSTTYVYKVRAFNNSSPRVFSTFSNKSTAVTPPN
jgi:hypothetical protein